MAEALRKAMDDWQPSQDSPLSWALFPSVHREAWVDLFIRYNTPLPTFAAVERLFSRARNILRASRSTLDEVNFEELVFLKGNMHVLGYQHYEEYKKEEEEKREQLEDLQNV